MARHIIILDNGNGLIKALMVNDVNRALVNPVAQVEMRPVWLEMHGRPFYGDDCSRELLSMLTLPGLDADRVLQRGVEGGNITSTENMAKIWMRTFTQIFGLDENRPELANRNSTTVGEMLANSVVVVTEPPANAVVNRLAVCDAMMGTTFNTEFPDKVNGVYFCTGAVLTALKWASAATLGTDPLLSKCMLVVDCGDGTTSAVPVIMFNAIPAGCVSANWGGHHASMSIWQWLQSSGRIIGLNESQYLDAKEILATACYVAEDSLAEERVRNPEPDRLVKGYSIPHEVRLAVGEMWFRAAGMGNGAALPSGLSYQSYAPVADSLQALVTNSMATCGYGNRGMLLPNILLGGGCSKMRGFSLRLENELKKLERHAACRTAIRVQCQGDQSTYLALQGAAKNLVVGDFADNDTMWYSKDSFRTLTQASRDGNIDLVQQQEARLTELFPQS